MRAGFSGFILILFQLLAAIRSLFLRQDILEVVYVGMVFFDASNHSFVARLGVGDKQNVQTLVCLRDSAACTHVIAIRFLQRLPCETEVRQQITLVSCNVPCEGKWAQRKDSSLVYTEFCVQIRIHYSRTAAAHVLKKFYNAQLSLLVVPSKAYNHYIFYSEHGRFVLNLGFSVKSAHSSLHCGCHFKWNKLFHQLFLLFCGQNMYWRKVWRLSEKYLYFYCGTSACYAFWFIWNSAIYMLYSLERCTYILWSMVWHKSRAELNEFLSKIKLFINCKVVLFIPTLGSKHYQALYYFVVNLTHTIVILTKTLSKQCKHFGKLKYAPGKHIPVCLHYFTGDFPVLTSVRPFILRPIFTQKLYM